MAARRGWFVILNLKLCGHISASARNRRSSGGNGPEGDKAQKGRFGYGGSRQARNGSKNITHFLRGSTVLSGKSICGRSFLGEARKASGKPGAWFKRNDLLSVGHEAVVAGSAKHKAVASNMSSSTANILADRPGAEREPIIYTTPVSDSYRGRKKGGLVP